MTRTLAAFAMSTLLAGGCASAPSSQAGSPARGSTPMQHTLVPRPTTFHPGTGDGFVVTPTTAIYVPAGNEEMMRIGRFLADWLGIAAGPTPPLFEVGTPPPRDAIVLQLGQIPDTAAEAYDLTVTA